VATLVSSGDNSTSEFQDAQGFDIVVIDVVTGRIITPADTSKRF